MTHKAMLAASRATFFALALLFIIIQDTYTQIIDCVEGGCDCPQIPTISGETCILNCAESSICRGEVLNCRDGDPCEIRCDNTRSCDSATINANGATDVSVICDTASSCIMSLDIKCGTGHCELQCNHPTACNNWARVDASSASSFQCIGDCPSFIPSPFSLLTDAPTIYTSINLSPNSTTTLTPSMIS